jgi:cellulose biosynthesis protein BcsQ
MAKIITFYNHKGGVSKTTTTFNTVHYLSTVANKRVLVVDADPQCNITELLLSNLINTMDEETAKTGKETELPGTSLLDILKPRIEGSIPIVDISRVEPIEVNNNLQLIKGDVSLSTIEDALAEAYIQRFSTKIHEKRNYIAFYDFINRYSSNKSFDYVFIDVGPSSGALTRTCILACDGLFVPLNPDRFSIQAIKTLSVIFARWFKDHKDIIHDFQQLGLPIKDSLPRLLGAIPQLYKKYRGRPKPGYDLWMKRVPTSMFETLIPTIKGIDSSTTTGLAIDNVIVTEIADFGSLSPCLQEVGKAVFNITQEDTKLIAGDDRPQPWSGSVWTDALERMDLFKNDFKKIWERIQWL